MYLVIDPDARLYINTLHRPFTFSMTGIHCNKEPVSQWDFTQSKFFLQQKKTKTILKRREICIVPLIQGIG